MVMNGFSGVPAGPTVVMEGHAAGTSLPATLFGGSSRYSATRSIELHMTVSTEDQEYPSNHSLEVKFQLRAKTAGPMDRHSGPHRAGDCNTRPATRDVSCKRKEGDHKETEGTQSIETEQKPTIKH